MGYDVHITRKTDWIDDEPRIPLSEWLALVEREPDMRHDGFAEATLADGGMLRTESEGLSVWTGYSQPSTAWFDYCDGDITVKNPDREILIRMSALAKALGAKVQGDEGELYDAQGVADRKPHQPTAKKPWWKWW